VSERHEVVDDPDALQAYLEAHAWGDGLPVVPPTPERVERMVDASGRAAADVVAEVDPRKGVATVEKIAINAVMAGCRPEYLPVVIAAVEAVAAPEFNLHGIQTTTNPVAPLLVVNGPVRRLIDLNCGRNALGPGRRANATIGRALRLVLLHVGGAVPERLDKATLGMPGKYTFCLGESEEESPWEPLSVERGFAPVDSTVTAIGAQGTSNVLALAGGAREALALTADAMAVMGNNNTLYGRGNPTVFFSPGHARQFVEQGYRTKRAVKEALFELSKIPRSRFPEREVFPLVPMRERALAGDAVCVTRRPDDIVVVVAGGPEPYHICYCANFGDSEAVTRPVRLPSPAA
jgi:hypothetical protein